MTGPLFVGCRAPGLAPGPPSPRTWAASRAGWCPSCPWSGAVSAEISSLLWKRPKWTPDICQDFRETAPTCGPLGGTISTPGDEFPRPAGNEESVESLPVTPGQPINLEHAIMLAEARHTLIARLIDDQRIDRAATHVPANTCRLPRLDTLPGADTLRVGRNLSQLASQLTGKPFQPRSHSAHSRRRLACACDSASLAACLTVGLSTTTSSIDEDSHSPTSCRAG